MIHRVSKSSTCVDQESERETSESLRRHESFPSAKLISKHLLREASCLKGEGSNDLLTQSGHKRPRRLFSFGSPLFFLSERRPRMTHERRWKLMCTGVLSQLAPFLFFSVCVCVSSPAPTEPDANDMSLIGFTYLLR